MKKVGKKSSIFSREQNHYNPFEHVLMFNAPGRKSKCSDGKKIRCSLLKNCFLLQYANFFIESRKNVLL